MSLQGRSAWPWLWLRHQYVEQADCQRRCLGLALVILQCLFEAELSWMLGYVTSKSVDGSKQPFPFKQRSELMVEDFELLLLVSMFDLVLLPALLPGLSWKGLASPLSPFLRCNYRKGDRNGWGMEVLPALLWGNKAVKQSFVMPFAEVFQWRDGKSFSMIKLQLIW